MSNNLVSVVVVLIKFEQQNVQLSVIDFSSRIQWCYFLSPLWINITKINTAVKGYHINENRDREEKRRLKKTDYNNI